MTTGFFLTAAFLAVATTAAANEATTLYHTGQVGLEDGYARTALDMSESHAVARDRDWSWTSGETLSGIAERWAQQDGALHALSRLERDQPDVQLTISGSIKAANHCMAIQTLEKGLLVAGTLPAITVYGDTAPCAR